MAKKKQQGRHCDYFIEKTTISEQTRHLFLALYDDMGAAIQLSIGTIQADNPVKAETVVNLQTEIDRKVAVFLNRKSANVVMNL